MRLGATVGAAWMLAAAWSAILPGRIAGSLLVLYGPGMLVGEPGALFCCVECLDARGAVTGRSLHGDEPCSCSISWRNLVEELILYVE